MAWHQPLSAILRQQPAARLASVRGSHAQGAASALLPLLEPLLCFTKAPCTTADSCRPLACAAGRQSGRALLSPTAFSASAPSHGGAARASSSVPEYPPPDATRSATADLCDKYVPEPVDVVSQRRVQIAQPIFRDFGGNLRFSGKASTVLCFENNPLVRQALGEPGEGRVLVVDGGGSMRCALLGDQLAEMGARNGWSGIIVHGCIRDSQDIGTMALGVKALATFPLKSSKRDPGFRDVAVTFAGVTIRPGDYVYADKDGILVAPEPLAL